MGAEMFDTDGQTDMVSLTVTFCNFANVPKFFLNKKKKHPTTTYKN